MTVGGSTHRCVAKADWIIDLGPEGGAGGGEVVAEGTPEQVAADPHSHTGQFLRRVLPAHDQPSTMDEQPVLAGKQGAS